MENILSNNGWIRVEDSMPDMDRLVWLFMSDGDVDLGCAFKDLEGVQKWAVIDGPIYASKGGIECEAEQDDVDVTHWHPVPELPKIEKGYET